jgi:hypothetical protein
MPLQTSGRPFARHPAKKLKAKSAHTAYLKIGWSAKRWHQKISIRDKGKKC